MTYGINRVLALLNMDGGITVILGMLLPESQSHRCGTLK